MKNKLTITYISLACIAIFLGNNMSYGADIDVDTSVAAGTGKVTPENIKIWVEGGKLNEEEKREHLKNACTRGDLDIVKFLLSKDVLPHKWVLKNLELQFKKDAEGLSKQTTVSEFIKERTEKQRKCLELIDCAHWSNKLLEASKVGDMMLVESLLKDEKCYSNLNNVLKKIGIYLEMQITKGELTEAEPLYQSIQTCVAMIQTAQTEFSYGADYKSVKAGSGKVTLENLKIWIENKQLSAEQQEDELRDACVRGDLEVSKFLLGKDVVPRRSLLPTLESLFKKNQAELSKKSDISQAQKDFSERQFTCLGLLECAYWSKDLLEAAKVGDSEKVKLLLRDKKCHNNLDTVFGQIRAYVLEQKAEGVLREGTPLYQNIKTCVGMIQTAIKIFADQQREAEKGLNIQVGPGVSKPSAAPNIQPEPPVSKPSQDPNIPQNGRANLTKSS